MNKNSVMIHDIQEDEIMDVDLISNEIENEIITVDDVDEDDEVIQVDEDIEAEEGDNEDDEDEDELELDDDDDIAEDEVEVIEAGIKRNNQKPVNGGISDRVNPKANNFKDLAKRLMKPIPDYPILEETWNVWEIKDWNSLKEDKVRGPTFKCGNYEWNILLFPNGNNNNQLAVYLEPHPLNKDDSDWYACAQFGLDIWNPNHPESHISSGSYHRFNRNETDWGFSNFLDLKSLYSPSFLKQQSPHVTNAILENNKVNITAYVKVIDDTSTGVLWHSFLDYDSKESSGFVGLNNQGATCYLNSLLQSYYTTKNFRKLVYQIPTETHIKGKSVPLSLQRIFYQLQNSNEPVGTLELTKSFGWDSSDAFTQHDVQELNRILMDKLESAIKGTPIEGELNNIFVGKMKSYIKCVNVPYESSRVEDFWDIQLNVKGFKTLEEAFKNYIEVEMLEGENKYQAGDEYGYQDAKKGVVFESFPPVLHLQLKRFEYDFMIDDLVKIDDNYEFPDSIDLSPYLDEELPTSIKQENWTYKLHGVLVHQGSISNGHYYALIKPGGTKNEWLRFDDDKVWKVTPNQVFYENFGANECSPETLVKMQKSEQNEYIMRRTTSAYMLVYYRESDLATVLPDDNNSIDEVIPEHVPRKLNAELEERANIERAKQEALYYINVKITTNDNFNNYNAFDLFPDSTNEKFYEPSLYDPKSNPLIMKVKREESFKMFYLQVGVQLKYISESVLKEPLETINIKNLPYRLISMNHRQNHTNRSDTPVPDDLFDNTVVQVFLECFNRKYDEMSFYVEEANKDLLTIASKLSEGLKTPNEFNFKDVLSKLSSNNEPTTDGNEFSNIFERSPNILLFVKYFDPITGEVRGLTHANVLKDEPIKSLIDPINKLLGFVKDTRLIIFEELSPNKLEALQVDSTFEKNELSNGDILCIQPYDYDSTGVKYDSLKSYYKFILTRFHVAVSPFYPNEDEEDTEFVKSDEDATKFAKDGTPIATNPTSGSSFDFWVSMQSSYIEFATEIADRIGGGVDPEYLRIFAVNNQRRFPLKRSTPISQIFGKAVLASQITNFEYEILSIPLEEYENMKLIKLNWLSSLIHYQTFEFLVPKKSIVGEDLMTKLLHKIDINPDHLGDILVWSGINHKYVDLIKFDREISSIPDTFDLFAGIFPAEVETLVNYDMLKRFDGPKEELPSTNGRSSLTPELEETHGYELRQVKYHNRKLNVIPGFHFHKNSSYHHGIPFIFPVFPSEKFSDTKARLRSKLGLGIKEFEKIKFALADINDKGRYIDHENDDFILYEELKKHTEQLSLALDHPDRSPRRQSQFDRGISIK
ncbi:ubiquitin carboxyl-terminal hydrolase 15 [[Candida] anglica]|uniref:ubiquitinyl hydrolase 1 n=1 Tax=[Candida] anglica TaxID=148631 RepID=A0ABP0EJG9_9ASCO